MTVPNMFTNPSAFLGGGGASQPGSGGSSGSSSSGGSGSQTPNFDPNKVNQISSNFLNPSSSQLGNGGSSSGGFDPNAINSQTFSFFNPNNMMPPGRRRRSLGNALVLYTTSSLNLKTCCMEIFLERHFYLHIWNKLVKDGNLIQSYNTSAIMTFFYFFVHM